MNTELHLLELLPAYSLGCLESDEIQRVEQHLSTCELCRAELRAYQQVVGELPHAMRLSDPPSELKTRILGAAQKLKTNDSAQPRPSWTQRFSQPSRQFAPAWGMVSAVLILLLVTSNLYFLSRLDRADQATNNQLASVALLGTENTPDASGLLVISKDGEQGTLVVDDLPDLPTDRQYQLWLIQNGERTNGGVFSVDEGGYAYLEIHAPQPLVDFDAFGVTVEPFGGSPGPTGEKVLGGEQSG